MPEFHHVNCCKCGARLCKEYDTYRFTWDGQPICYDCWEEGLDEETGNFDQQ